MEVDVQEYEQLYRAVKRSQPSVVDANGRPTSALFKQDDGVSVDRDGERDEPIIVESFQNRLGKRLNGLVKVSAGVCLNNDMAVIPEPSHNEYHAEIFENEQKEPLSSKHAYLLAKNAEIVVQSKREKFIDVK